MAFYMNAVNVSADHYGRAVVDGGQKPDTVAVSYYAPPTEMKRVGDDSVVDPGQKPDGVPVSYYPSLAPITATPMKRVGVDDPVGEVVADATATELCAAPAANDNPLGVQTVVSDSVVVVGSPGVGPSAPGVHPAVVAPQMPKQKLTVGATQLTMEQKITFARLAIAWKSQGRPMREFENLMKAAGYQVSPSSLTQWMRQPDATCVLPPPRRRKDKDSRRKFVRSWIPKI